MRKIFVTTVQLIILAEDKDEASDAVNNILTECERLYDWHYLKVGKQRLTPTRDYGHTIEVAKKEGEMHGPTSRVFHQSKAAELLLHKALSAIEQVRADIVDDTGSLFGCFITGFQRGNVVCQTSDSPVCKLCRDCQ